MGYGDMEYMDFLQEQQESQQQLEDTLTEQRKAYLEGEIEDLNEDLSLVDSPVYRGSMQADLNAAQRELDSLNNGGGTDYGFDNMAPAAYAPIDEMTGIPPELAGDVTHNVVVTPGDGGEAYTVPFDEIPSDAQGDLVNQLSQDQAAMDEQIPDSELYGEETLPPSELEIVPGDIDGDGINESDIAFREGNGIMEFGVQSDIDGDGLYNDFSAYGVAVDTDGDGYYDTGYIIYDLDGDEIFEGMEPLDESMFTGEDTSLEVEPTNLDIDNEGRGTYYEELSRFDPEAADAEAVSGNPEDAIDHWEFQGDTQRCTVYSQMSVIEQITGTELDPDELSAFAVENGWLDEENGASLEDMNKLIESYGIETETSFDNDISDLESTLEDGNKAIVCIDADEIWYGENDDMYIPNDSPNHAVEVIGIDRSDPENPMVILNDSGVPEGAGEMVPLDVFEDAWEDSSNYLVTAMG